MPDQDIKTRMGEAILHADAELAFDLVNEIDAVLEQIKDANDSEYQRYDAMKQQLLFVSFRFLSDRSIEEWFERSPLSMTTLPETFDLIATIKGRLVFEYFLQDRNVLRDKWRAAMLRSVDRLGTTPIKLGDSEVPPSVANWLKLYTSEVGSGRPSTVKVARFFAQNPSVQTLSPVQRTQLKRLIAIFEFFKARSEDLSGFEDTLIISDESGRPFVLGNGKLTEMYDDEMLADLKERKAKGELSLEQVAELSRAYPDEFKIDTKYVPKSPAIASFDGQDLAARAQSFIADQRTKFAHRVPATGVPLPNRTAALVAMLHKAMSRGQEADMILAKEILQFVLSDKERFVNFMRHQSIITLLQTELPAAIGEKNKEVIRQSPTSPLALQALLQIVFSARFKLSAAEATWQSFDVTQRLSMEFKDLKTVVTYDPSQNALVWRYG